MINLEAIKARVEAWKGTGSAEDALAAARLARDVPVLLGEVKRLQTALDESQLRSIEARNPGIDLDDVRRIRAGAGTAPEPDTGWGVFDV